MSLQPAVLEVDNFVKSYILYPLCFVANKSIASVVVKIHRGMYVGKAVIIVDKFREKSFVQSQLARVYDDIVTNILLHLPQNYASFVASRIISFSIYYYTSNITLIRPMDSTARLLIISDLANIEVAFEHLILKATLSLTLNKIDGGKPYAELRAVRLMLFWSILKDKELSTECISKMILREMWVKDIRPSVVLHFLFTFAPTLLSSPQKNLGISLEEYINILVKGDGPTSDGESKAWISTMACCDVYKQRECIDYSSTNDGDNRVVAILDVVGPELLKRWRH